MCLQGYDGLILSLYVARLEEKDMFNNTPYEKSQINIETLRISQSSITLESFNNAAVSSPGTAGSLTKGFSRSQENIATQASEKEIEAFTEMTLNNSWILPQVTAPTSAKKTFGRKKGKSMAEDDFKPVQLKTLTPRKYKRHAGTTGFPSQPTSVTFVPGISYGTETGTHGDMSQLTREFSSFDFSINSTTKRVQSPSPIPSNGRSVAASTASKGKPSSSMGYHGTTVGTEDRAQTTDTPDAGRKSAGYEGNSNAAPTMTTKSKQGAEGKGSLKAARTRSPGNRGSKKQKDSAEQHRPKTSSEHLSSPTNTPAPFFFPNLMNVPTSPVVLSFKPINLDDYV